MKINKKTILAIGTIDRKSIKETEFNWCRKTNSFTTDLECVGLLLRGVDCITLTAGSGSTLKAGWNSTLEAGESSTLKAGENSTLKAGGDSTLEAGSDSTLEAGWGSTLKAESDSTLKAGWNSTLEAGWGSTLKAESDSTLKAGRDSTLKAGCNSTLEAGRDSTLITSYLSEIRVEGNDVVVRRTDVTQVLVLQKGQIIKFLPYKIEGYLEKINGKWYLNGDTTLGEYTLDDEILAKVIHTKGNVRKVQIHGTDKVSFLIEQDGAFSHSETLQQAKQDLIFKLLTRDVSEYESLTLNTILPLSEMVVAYRSITGACSLGVKTFVESIEVKEEYSIKEIIKITEGQYGNDAFRQFFNKEGK